MIACTNRWISFNVYSVLLRLNGNNFNFNFLIGKSFQLKRLNLIYGSECISRCDFSVYFLLHVKLNFQIIHIYCFIERIDALIVELKVCSLCTIVIRINIKFIEIYRSFSNNVHKKNSFFDYLSEIINIKHIYTIRKSHLFYA